MHLDRFIVNAIKNNEINLIIIISAAGVCVCVRCAGGICMSRQGPNNEPD